jgi:phosphate/phosphite/phosphonate ABC transporter binding protein
MTDTKTPVPWEKVPQGRRLGRYQLAERLATGGMAEIFLAMERGPGGLERLVVVKRILPHLAIHDTFVEMFLQEARFVARMNHPNVVQIFELGEQDPKEPGDKGAFYIAMEYVAGASLRELMRAAALQKREVPIEVALSVVTQACAGAHAAHELTDAQGKSIGLVHRDISPHNLMVTREGHVKLLDFGIAKATEVALENTRTGALKGKVHYMSPEQCRQEQLDRRSDVFALGIVLWELLTARRLFKRENDLESMQAIVTGDTWDVREFRADVPSEIAAVISRALATDRDNRYLSADDFRRAIQSAAEKCQIAIGSDGIAPFVVDVCARKLASDERAVEEAIERTMISLPDELEEGDRTAVERPSAKALQSPPDTNTGSNTGVTSAEASALQPRPASGGWRMSAVLSLVIVGLLVAGGYLMRDKLFPPPPPEAPPPVATSGAVIRLGQAPTVDPAELIKEFAPLERYLEQATGRPFEIIIGESYTDVGNKLIDGEIDFGFLPPNLYVKTKERWPELDPLVFKLQDGASGSDAVLLTNEANRDLASAADLKGRKLCYTDEASTSGNVMPRAHLRKVGLDPDVDVEWHRSGNHLQLLRDLVANKCDAGGTYSGAYLRGDEKGVPVSQLRVVAITGRAPQDSLCSGSKASAADKQVVKAALLAFNPERDLGVDYVGTLERMSGFVEATDEAYATLRDAINSEAVDKTAPAEDDEPKKKKRRRKKKPSKPKKAKKAKTDG